MSNDIATLERMLRSDAALEQARLAQSGAINSQQLLKQPLSNFNTGSLRNPANIPSLERLQASIRVQAYMRSGTIQHMPAFVPKSNVTSSASGGGGLTPNASAAMASAEATANATLTRSVNAPHQIQLPTTAQLTRQARTIGPSLARRLGPALLGGLAEAGASYLQAGNDSLNDALRNQLPSNVQPVWDGVAGPNGLLERWLTPPNIAGAREGLRQLQDLDRLRNGLPARSQAGQIAEQLTCQIFGIGCPETSPEGIPNLGSPGSEPPFYGGQSSGVPYIVDVYRTAYNADGSVKDNYPGVFSAVAIGPVQGVRVRESGVEVMEILHNGTPVYIGNLNIPSEYYGDYRIVSIRRQDGQPDTGGNPQALPDADNRPATSPALPNRQVFPPPNAPRQPDSLIPNPATTPITPTPVAPPGTTTPDPPPPDSDEDSPLSPFNPMSPFIPAFMPARPPTGQRGFNPSGAPQGGSALDNPRVATGTQPQTPTCRYDSSNIAGRVDQTNVTLNAVQLFMEQQMMSKLNTIDAKLGPQIPGGGVSGFLGKMFDFAKKTWNFLQVDRVLSVLTWIAVLHNAYMLSNALGQTLFSAISQALDAFGIEDADGNALDIGSIVGRWTEGFFKNLLGADTVDGIKEGWAKYNRIYQAATNLLYSIQSMVYSLSEILEVISNYAGRIGNALQRSGAILQNSFNWMNPNVNYTDNRFFRFLQRTQDGVELVEQISSEVLSIQETSAEIAEQSNQFNQLIKEEEDKVSVTEIEARAGQKRPETKINPSDESRAELGDD